MKIAVPSDDSINIARHFGRASGFKIFEIENNSIKESGYRKNTFTGHSKGLHVEHHNHGEHEHHHSHQGILEGLVDCEVVIAGGMGRRAYNDLAKAGKQVFVTQVKNAEEAVKSYLSKELEHNDEICCEH